MSDREFDDGRIVPLIWAAEAIAAGGSDGWQLAMLEARRREAGHLSLRLRREGPWGDEPQRLRPDIAVGLTRWCQDLALFDQCDWSGFDLAVTVDGAFEIRHVYAAEAAHKGNNR